MIEDRTRNINKPPEYKIPRKQEIEAHLAQVAELGLVRPDHERADWTGPCACMRKREKGEKKG